VSTEDPILNDYRVASITRTRKSIDRLDQYVLGHQKAVAQMPPPCHRSRMQSIGSPRHGDQESRVYQGHGRFGVP